MSAEYATLEDVRTLYRSLTAAEEARTSALLPIVSAMIRTEAAKSGKDFDAMIVEEPDLAIVAKCVVVDVVKRALMQNDDTAPMSQYSESALGYSVSGTFFNPSGAVYLLDAELKRLHLKTQRISCVSMIPESEGAECS